MHFNLNAWSKTHVWIKQKQKKHLIELKWIAKLDAVTLFILIYRLKTLAMALENRPTVSAASQ